MDWFYHVLSGPIVLSKDMTYRLLVAVLILYFLPSVVAAAKGMAKLIPLFFTNLLLGWTVVGWAGVLVWALRGEIKKGKPVRKNRERWAEAIPETPEIATPQQRQPYEPKKDSRSHPFAPSEEMHIQMSQKGL